MATMATGDSGSLEPVAVSQVQSGEMYHLRIGEDVDLTEFQADRTGTVDFSMLAYGTAGDFGVRAFSRGVDVGNGGDHTFSLPGTEGDDVVIDEPTPPSREGDNETDLTSATGSATLQSSMELPLAEDVTMLDAPDGVSAPDDPPPCRGGDYEFILTEQDLGWRRPIRFSLVSTYQSAVKRPTEASFCRTTKAPRRS